MMSLVKYFFSMFQEQDNTTLIVVFPGFGLYPKDYDAILPKSIPKIYLDLWSDEELEFIKSNVGVPGTPSYRDWFQDKIIYCEDEVEHLLLGLEYEHMKKIVFFGHSLGSELADCVTHYADFTVTYGGVISVDNDSVLNLLGTEDKIASRYFDDFPKFAEAVVDGTHFSCVSDEAAARSLRWRDEIKIPPIEEVSHDPAYAAKVKAKIRRRIAEFISKASTYASDDHSQGTL